MEYNDPSTYKRIDTLDNKQRLFVRYTGKEVHLAIVSQLSEDRRDTTHFYLSPEQAQALVVAIPSDAPTS